MNEPTNEGLRLGRIARPIASRLKCHRELWAYVSAEDLDEIVRDNPDSYLRLLDTWKELLKEAAYFRIDQNVAHIACVGKGPKGDVRLFEVVGAKEGNALILSKVKDGVEPHPDWQSVRQAHERNRAKRPDED